MHRGSAQQRCGAPVVSTPTIPKVLHFPGLSLPSQGLQGQAGGEGSQSHLL